jgi:hypothetical protein
VICSGEKKPQAALFFEEAYAFLLSLIFSYEISIWLVNGIGYEVNPLLGSAVSKRGSSKGNKEYHALE